MELQGDFAAKNSPVNSFIDFISSLKFSDIYDQEVKSPTSKIIEVGNMRYQVKQDSEGSSLFESNQRKENNVKSNQLDKEKDINSNNEEAPAFLHVNITPLSADAFMAQLPVNLYSFVKELVSVVKLHNVKENSIEYAFKFRELNLQVMIKKHEDILKILIFVGDETLKKEFTKDRQDVMLSILQSKLDTEQIDVEFVFDFTQMSDEKNNSEDNDSSPNENLENITEIEEEVE